MKTKFFASIVVFLLIYASYHYFSSSNSTPPLPTGGETEIFQGADEEGNQNKRAAWLELMHQAAPGDHWQKMEYQNQMKRHELRKEMRRQASFQEDETEEFANGLLIGTWKERGSNNQAGSVYETLLDTDDQLLYLVSAGGTLFRGPIDGSNWEVVNQDLQLDRGLLSFIESEGQKRMLSIIGGIPHFSNDKGITWTASTGVEVWDNVFGGSKDVTILPDEGKTIFLLSKEDNSNSFKIYKSTDQGESFEIAQTLAFNDNNQILVY